VSVFLIFWVKSQNVVMNQILFIRLGKNKVFSYEVKRFPICIDMEYVKMLLAVRWDIKK